MRRLPAVWLVLSWLSGAPPGALAQEPPPNRSPARQPAARTRPGAPARRAATPAPKALSPLERRIEAVEDGLVPSVRVRGKPVTGMTLVQRMKKYHVQGLSVAVISDYAIEWIKSYGVADAASRAPADSGTRFQVGSVSQPVAAAVALSLAQSRKLDLDRDVNRSLKSWKIPKSTFTRGRPVTVRALLAHSAGLVPTVAPGYPREGPLPTLGQILAGTPPASTPPITLQAPPGQDFGTGAADYVVVQQVLLDATKRPFADLAREMVLEPLGMVHSTFDQSPRDQPGAAAAAGHDGGGNPIAGKARAYPEQAAAGLWTTAGDLARFVLDLQLASAGRPATVFRPETARQLLTAEHVGWPALGVRLAGTDESARFHAAGATDGFQAEVVGYIHRGQGAVVLTNTAGGGSLIAELLNGIARAYGWPDYVPPEKTIARVDPRVFDRFVGTYSSDDRTLSVARRGNRLFVGEPGKESVELLPESVSDFFTVDPPETYSFVFDEQGKVRAFTRRRRDEEARWDRR